MNDGANIEISTQTIEFEPVSLPAFVVGMGSGWRNQGGCFIPSPESQIGMLGAAAMTNEIEKALKTPEGAFSASVTPPSPPTVNSGCPPGLRGGFRVQYGSCEVHHRTFNSDEDCGSCCEACDPMEVIEAASKEKGEAENE